MRKEQQETVARKENFMILKADDSWDSYDEAAEKGPFAFFLKVLVPVVLVIVIIAVIGYVFGWFGEAATVAREEFGPRAAVKKYEWFKDKSNSLSAAEKRIKITKTALESFKKDAGPRKDWTFEDKDEYSRLTTDLRGQEAHFEQLKAEYRAACEKVHWEVFRGDDKIIRWANEVTGSD